MPLKAGLHIGLQMPGRCLTATMAHPSYPVQFCDLLKKSPHLGSDAAGLHIVV